MLQLHLSDQQFNCLVKGNLILETWWYVPSTSEIYVDVELESVLWISTNSWVAHRTTHGGKLDYLNHFLVARIILTKRLKQICFLVINTKFECFLFNHVSTYRELGCPSGDFGGQIGSPDRVMVRMKNLETLLFSCNSFRWVRIPSGQWNLNQNTKIFIQGNALENIACKMDAIVSWPQYNYFPDPGIILDMGLANEKSRYIMTPSLIGWACTQNDSCRLTCSRPCRTGSSRALVWVLSAPKRPPMSCWEGDCGSQPVKQNIRQ